MNSIRHCAVLERCAAGIESADMSPATSRAGAVSRGFGRQCGRQTRARGEVGRGDYFAGWAAIGVGLVIISKSSVRKGVTGRPSLLKRLHTGLSAQA